MSSIPSPPLEIKTQNGISVTSEPEYILLTRAYFMFMFIVQFEVKQLWMSVHGETQTHMDKSKNRAKLFHLKAAC